MKEKGENKEERYTGVCATLNDALLVSGRVYQRVAGEDEKVKRANLMTLVEEIKERER